MHQQLFNLLEEYHTIPDSDKEWVCRFFNSYEIKEGAHLVEPGTFSNVLYFICEGVMKVSILNEKGSLVTYYFLAEDHLCTILNSFHNDSRSEVYLSAVTDAKLLGIAKKDLLQLYEKLPYFKGIIDEVFQEMMMRKINIRNTYLGIDATERYNTFLSTQHNIASRVPLSDVASYLGITQQSLSRIRKNK